MTEFAQNVGWWLFIAAVMAAVGHIVQTILKLVWDQGALGEEVNAGEALIASVSTVVSWFQLLKSSLWATVCTVVVFFLLWGSTEVGFYASLGFSAMTYTIGQFVAPMILRRLKPVASQTTQAVSPEKSSDS